MHKYDLRVPPPESFPLLQFNSPRIMQLELGLALPAAGDLMSELRLPAEKRTAGRKRGVDQMLDKITLPLFMHSKDEDEDDKEQELNSGGGGRVLVGWPPVRSSRRRASCVKVNMEGVAIGRKVDLSLHDSYQDLFRTLNSMFPRKQREIGDEDAGYYKVTYEDEDGDWMLVGDVPWEAFIQSVKRLKIPN